MKRLQLLVAGINYPPEHTGIAPYTGAMADALHAQGFGVDVLTAHPHYPEWRIAEGYGQWRSQEAINGVQVTRLRHLVPRNTQGLERAVSEISFGLRQVFSRWHRPDVVLAVSPALLSSALVVAKASALRIPTVVWVQDLYGVGAAETGGGGLVTRLLKAVEGVVLRRASRVVVIHDRFASRIHRDYKVPLESIDVVRNWSHVEAPAPMSSHAAREALGWRLEGAVVLHAGNMGAKQGLENVIDAARLAGETNKAITFVLMGAGSELAKLKTLGAGVPNLVFKEGVSNADFTTALQAADILLVNEKPGVSEMAVPSKLTSYFAAGRPVIAATDPEGTTAHEVMAAQAGVVVPAGAPQELLLCALQLASDKELSSQLGTAAGAYRLNTLSPHAAVKAMKSSLESAGIPDSHA